MYNMRSEVGGLSRREYWTSSQEKYGNAGAVEGTVSVLLTDWEGVSATERRPVRSCGSARRILRESVLSGPSETLFMVLA